MTATHGRVITKLRKEVIKTEKGYYHAKEVVTFKPGCDGVYISASTIGIRNLVLPGGYANLFGQMVVEVAGGKTPLRAAYVALLRNSIASSKIKPKKDDTYFETFMNDRVGGPKVIASNFNADSDLYNKHFNSERSVGLVDFAVRDEDLPFYVDFIQMGCNTTETIFAELRHRGATHIIFADSSCNSLGKNEIWEEGVMREEPCNAADARACHLHVGADGIPKPWTGGKTRKKKIRLKICFL